MRGAAEMTFWEHLGELRRRLLYSALAVGAAFLVAWYHAKALFRFLEAPILPYLPPGHRLVFTELAAPFLTYLKTALLFGIVAASPVILYQVWAFIAPGLRPPERRAVAPFMLGTVVFFLLGCAFGYAVAFPRVCEFLLAVGGDFSPMLTLDRYFGLMSKVILGLGLVFEMPVLAYFLARMGVLTVPFLVHWWRYVIVGIFIVAAVITPTPDIATQLVFAVPMLALYGVSILVTWVFQKRPARDG